MKLRRSEGGFTIVELLVVIVVIAILVALTLPNLFGLQKRARDDTRKNDLKNIQAQLETYFNDNTHYPSQLSTLVPDYLSSVPADPKSGAYTYTPAPSGCTNNCSSYALAATLENDKDPQATNGVYTVNSANQ